MKIYVASSWRNVWQPGVVRFLRNLGHDVYDFKNPRPGDTGFSWSEIDQNWKSWSPEQYRTALNHPIARAGYTSDITALEECDACILVQPCGTSAHLELGWACGTGKRASVLFPLDFSVTREDAQGHSLGNTACVPCGDLDGCWIPGKLRLIEPELMVKMASVVLLSSAELEMWVNGKKGPAPMFHGSHIGASLRPCLRCTNIRAPGRSLCDKCHNEQRRTNAAKARRLRTEVRRKGGG